MVNIVLIHGLGGAGFTLKPIQWAMIHKAWIFEYESTGLLNSTLQQLSDFIDQLQEEPVILVGHSLGGLIATLCTHSRVMGVVTVSSPHDSCSMVKSVARWVPETVKDYLFGNVYDTLVAKPFKLNKPMICITSSLLPVLLFDGRVWTEEMMHPDAESQLHLTWSDHILQLFDPRMWTMINIAVERLLHSVEPWVYFELQNDNEELVMGSSSHAFVSNNC